MVCANVSGTHTLPLLVIGKSKKPRCFKNVSCLPTLYKAQKSAWMNSALFSEWYTKDFIPNVKKLREREGKTGKVLPILDNAPCHPPVEILNAIDDDFSVMYLPPNVTALVQPMDQGVIEKLKRIYRKQVLRRLFLAENDKESVVAFAKKLNMKDACYMLAEAWDSLERQNLKNAWNKLWPDLEGEQDSNDDHREEITDLVQSIPGFQECDEEDVETWLASDAEDCGFQMLNDDEIVTSVQEESDPVDDETDEDEDNIINESSKGPSSSDAFAALETAMEWYEQQSECFPTQLLLLKRIRDLAAKKRRCTM
ncbi:jerky protein, partial [Biomphalaria pfeifferi]